MKVLYLLNRVQQDSIGSIREGKNNDDHLYGLLRLSQHGIKAGYLEIEQYFPRWLAHFLRKHILTIYWAHLPLFSKFFSHDIIFSSMAFGSQLLHTLYPFKKPKWVMLDFGLMGLLGKETALKQKLLAFIAARASGVVTIDAYEKEALEKRFSSLRGKIAYMRFGVDTNFFVPSMEEHDRHIIFSPGRDPGRDFSTLFEAIRDLPVSVVLTARPENIQKLFPLPPAVTNTDLTAEAYVSMFVKSDIVVIPLDTRSGVNNAMGCSTLVEAMAMGKAVIATRTKTTESYIEDGHTGILVSAQDPVRLREAIRSLLDDPHKRTALGAAARDFVESNCSADGFADALAAYFKRIVE